MERWQMVQDSKRSQNNQMGTREEVEHPLRLEDIEFLANPNLKFIIFGGKGGSGKTTSAAATALYLSRVNLEKRILVMSTDPAHSLGDCFGVAIGNKITSIKENVWGLEIDAGALLEKYKVKHGMVIKKIADRGTFFDKEDIEDFFTQSLPGLDEVMAIIHIADLLKAEEYDLIILDTAPTGHTMVLLSLPEKMEQWVRLMDMLMEKHRYMMKAMVGRYKRDECDEFLDSQGNDMRRVRQLLTDAKTTEFVPVTIPEPMSIYEAERAVQSLKKYRIAVNSVIVNRVIAGDGCPFCSARRQETEKYIREIEQKFSSYNLIRMPLFPYQIQGMERLSEYAQVLFGETKYTPPPEPEVLAEVIPLAKGGLSDIVERDLNFLIFGGKGGVGKTSVAAASAFYLARHKPDKRVLVFSTDPAHSLSDSLEQHIGNEIAQISGVDNLYALEIDGTRMFEDLKQQYRDAIDEVFEKFLGSTGMDVKFDREILKELLSVAPPGLDELMALRKIMELMKEGEYGLFVLDAAASGHLLRFLELPHLVRGWLKSAFKLLIKYRGIVKLNKVTESLLDLSRDIGKILEVFSNPQGTEFVMLTIPEEMGVEEMEDLAKSITSLKIPWSHTVINMIIPPTNCGFCATRRKEQQKYIQKIEAKSSDHTIVHIPLLPHEVRGLEYLSELAEIMCGR